MRERSKYSNYSDAYPTAGGLYYWASKLGGPGWGWFTGWFNLIGQVAVCLRTVHRWFLFPSQMILMVILGSLFILTSTFTQEIYVLHLSTDILLTCIFRHYLL